MKPITRIAAVVCLLVTACALWAEGTADYSAQARLPRFPNISLMIVVPEHVSGEPSQAPTAETELIRLFLDANYTVIDQPQYASSRYSSRMDRVLRDPTGSDTQRLTASTGADILIVGQASVGQAVDAGGGAVGCQAQVSIRAVPTCGGGQIIAIAATTAKAVEATRSAAAVNALKQAAERAGRQLMARIGNFVGGPTAPPPAPGTDWVAQNPDLPEPVAGPAQSLRPGKPTVAVLKFDDSAQWAMAGRKLGQQVPALISNELRRTGRFIVVERDNLDAVKRVNVDQASGWFATDGKPSGLGNLTPIDYAIIARVTEHADKTVGGLIGGLLQAGVGIGAQEAVVKIYIEIVDVTTGEIINSGEATGKATGKVGGALLRPHARVGGGYIVLDDTAFGRATRKAIAGVVKRVLMTIPGAETPPAECDRCPGCQLEAPVGAQFCPQCGARLPR